MALREPEASLVGSRLDHFQVIAELGRGGMGVVYLADDEKLSRVVALKVLRPELGRDPARRERFLREARAAAAVTHPNVAAIYEVGEADGRVYLVMERVEGKPLRAELDGTPLENGRLVSVARGIAAALARAHDKGVIHRDLKPENVLLAEDGSPKVVDFGLAKLVRDDEPTSGEAKTEVQLSEEGAAMGTPAYMSPEQARGVAVDHRTDLFSFGILLYELATGERPFRGSTAMDVIVAIARDEPAPPRAMNPALPDAVERVILRCLAKEPAGRYASAHEIVRELDGERAREAAPTVRVATSASDRKSELILLERVREFWIDGVLAQATRDEMRLDLTKDERKDAVDRGLDLAAPRLDEDETPIAADVSIVDYFDRRGRALLVLGEPGAGKTVTLLELAKALVARAVADPSAPLPVVLGLTTWRDPKQPLEDWIAAQLRDAYRIPERVGRAWIEADRLALLLDGLDEVAPALVADCVRAVNGFRERRGFVELAVACRRTDYEALPTRLKLDAAIFLRALAPAQIDAYVAAGGARLDPLARALAEDAELRELAASPLMLNIMSLSYGTEITPGGARGASDAGEPAADKKTALFHRYVDRMLRRREGRLPLPRDAMLRSFVWLAREMQARNQAVFQLEDLQPTSLPRGRSRWLYFAVTRLGLAMLFVLGFSVNDAPWVFRVALVTGTWAALVVLDERLASKPPLATRSWRAALLDFGRLFAFLAATLAVVLTAQNLVQHGASTFSDSLAFGGIAGSLVALPLAILLAQRRGRLAIGKDVRTVESVRVRGKVFAIAATLLAVAPAIGLWFPFRHDAAPEVAIFDARTLARERVLASRPAHAKLSPDGLTAFVVGDLDRDGKAFDLETGAVRSANVAGPLVPDPSGKLLANFDPEDADGKIRVLDARDFHVLRTIDRPQAANVREAISAVTFSSSGRLLARAGALSILVDPMTGGRVATFEGRAVLAGDGRHVIILADHPGGAILFREDGARVAELPFTPAEISARRPDALAADPSGTWLAVVVGDCLFRVDFEKPTERRLVPTPQCREAPPVAGHGTPALLGFAPHTDLLVLGQSKGLVFLDRSGVVRREVAAGRPDELLVGDARVIVLTARELAAYTTDGAPAGTAKLPEARAPWADASVELSADGSRVVTASSSPRPRSLALGALLFGTLIAFGISLEAGVVRQKTRVNEGIHRTARRALMIGLVLGGFIGAATYSYEVLLTSEPGAVGPSAGLGLFVGIAFAIGFGGLDLFCHVCVRAILARRGELPVRAVRFLESGVQLIFLRRVGGGFMFIHRLVLEHFALSASASGDATANRRAAASALPRSGGA